MTLRERQPNSISNTGVANNADFIRHEKVERYRTGIADFFRRVNSTLAGKTVLMKWADEYSLYSSHRDAVAFTDGESVFINGKFFTDSIESHIIGGSLLGATGPIARMKGASYHELAHIMYTPRQNAQPIKELIELQASRVGASWQGNLMRAFNMLEDQRIETRFSAKYRSAATYFSLMCVEYIARFQDTPHGAEDRVAQLAFPLMYGRRFMGDLIDAAEKIHLEYIAKNNLSCDVEKLKSAIDGYRPLVFPSDSQKAIECVVMFDEYMLDLMNPPNQEQGGREYDNQHDDNNWSGAGQDSKHEYHKKGTPSRSSEQRHDARDAEEWIEDLEDSSGGDAESDSSSDMDSGESNSDSGSGSSETASDGESKGRQEQSSGDEETSNSKDGGYSAGSGSSSDRGERDKSADQVAEFLRNILDSGVEYEKETKKDSIRDVKSIHNSITTARRSARPDRRGSEPRPVSPTMRLASRKIQDAFTVIRSEGEDIWLANQSSGRLNTRELMNARGLSFDVFDEWIDVGDDANSIEVVILIDQSSSMAGFEMRSVSSALWIIRNACIALDIPVTAIGYDDASRLLYGPSCPSSHTMWDDLKSHGSTDPADALEWALQIFRTSRAKHKLLFSLTDGEWPYHNQVDMLMRSIRTEGVKTTLLVQGAWDGFYEDGSYSSPSDINLPHHSKKVKFRFPGINTSKSVPKNYGHDRMIRIGDSERELPDVVSQALEKLAIASVTSA